MLAGAISCRFKSCSPHQNSRADLDIEVGPFANLLDRPVVWLLFPLGGAVTVKVYDFGSDGGTLTVIFIAVKTPKPSLLPSITTTASGATSLAVPCFSPI